MYNHICIDLIITYKHVVERALRCVLLCTHSFSFTPLFIPMKKCPIFYMIIIYIILTHTHTNAYREREEQTWAERKEVCV